MPDVLSQKQIDDLLKGIKTSEVDLFSTEESGKGKIKEYDFKSPKKFTKEQLRALGGLHENLARVLTSFFTGYFRNNTEITVEQIEEQRFYEFNNALQDTALISLVDLKPTNNNLSEIPIILDLSTEIGYYMIERLLGGPGNGYKINRDYTDIEVAILETIFKKISLLMQDVWSSYIEVEAQFNGIETNARMLQTHSPDEVVVIVLIRLKIKELIGNLSICIPAVNLEKLIGSFSSKYIRVNKRQDAEKNEQRKKNILESLVQSDLELKGVFHHLQLDLQDILKLQVDDVIPLNKALQSDVTVMIEDVPWFTAELGETRVKKALKIKTLSQQ